MVRDARRYRWLRQWDVGSAVVSYSKNNGSLGGVVECSEPFWGNGKRLDDAVDYFSQRTPRRSRLVGKAQ